MKLNLRMLAAASALLFGGVFPATVISHQKDNDGGAMELGHKSMMSGDHMGMMDHMPMMGGGHHRGMMGIYRELDLNAEQQQKINDIEYGLRKKHWEIMGQMIDQQAALQKAYATDRPDPKTVGSVYSQIFDLKRQMIEAALEAKNGMMDVLTEDQLAQMRKMRHGHGGMTHGHGMMHGQGVQDN